MKNVRNTAEQFSTANYERPAGSRNKATFTIESLFPDNAEELKQTAIKRTL